METMTLSHLADLIIVIGFASLVGTLVGSGLGHFIIFIVGKIRDAWRKRHPKKKPEAVQ